MSADFSHRIHDWDDNTLSIQTWEGEFPVFVTVFDSYNRDKATIELEASQVDELIAALQKTKERRNATDH